MNASRGNLFMRDDTFFGVCEGLGEDLRIPSNFIRAAFAFGLFFNPLAVVVVYAALGGLVLFSRLVFPVPRGRTAPRAKAADAQREASAPAPAELAAAEEPELAQAA